MKISTLIILLFYVFCTFGQRKEKYDQLIDSLERTGQSEEILLFFEQEVNNHPKDEEALRRLAYLHLSENRLDLAEQYYKELLELNPRCKVCYMNIGIIYSYKKEFNKSLGSFNKAIEIAPGDARIYANRSFLKESMNDLLGALSDLNKAVELAPENASFYISRGMFYANKNRYQAIKDFSTAIELAPTNASPRFERSRVYYEEQRVKEALVDINKAIELDSTREAFYNSRAIIYSLLKEHKKATLDFTKAIQIDSTDYRFYYNRSIEEYALEDMNGYCFDIRKSHSILAEIDSENSLKQEFENSIGSFCDTNRASYYYQRGIAFYNLRHYEKAIQIYSVGIRKFPNNSMVLSFRGNAYLELQEFEKALKDYSQSIKDKENVALDIERNQKHTLLSGESTETFVNGFVASMYISISQCLLGLGQFEKALSEINKGIEIAPNLKEFGIENYYNTRGNVFLAMGKYQLALNDFNRSIQHNDTFCFGYVNKAIAKVNIANKKPTKIRKTFVIRNSLNNQLFNVNWSLPVSFKFKKSDTNVSSALSDCHKAIEIDPSLDYAYYVRGQIKKMLIQGDYCYDLIKARNLGYPVEETLLSDCRHLILD